MEPDEQGIELEMVRGQIISLSKKFYPLLEKDAKLSLALLSVFCIPVDKNDWSVLQ